NPLSIQWEKLGALVKPEAIKIKNVDEIDAALLGYRKVDEGSVVFKEPITTAELEASPAYQHASAIQRKAAQGRLKARTKEWSKYETQYREMARPLDQGGGVDVAFDYTANGAAVPPQTTVAEKVAFALDPVASQGANYYIVKMANNSGELERITGDVDLVAVTKANGAIMSPEERLDIYLNLQDTVGIQHGDTLSWLQDGELLGPAKIDLLHDHAPGGEPLAVFDPTGSARATFIRPKYTFFNTADKQGRIWYVGGYRTPASTAYHFGQLAYPMFSSAVNTASPWLTPAGWYRQVAKPPPPKMQRHLRMQHRFAAPVALLGGNCTWRFTSDSTAGLAYPDGKGGLQQWTATTGWKSLDVTSCWYSTKPPVGSPLGADHVLRLLPQTSLAAESGVGATRITVNGIHAVEPTLSSNTPWFTVGETIVIDPGSKNAETGVISKMSMSLNAGTLTLKSPLIHVHLGGDMLSVEPLRP
ncbi:MAG TPA: hypothetical protein VG815_01820, partial [Chloroflexota bacterium]|nr:hypothetical protein [Chloroflexota bacterium]